MRKELQFSDAEIDAGLFNALFVLGRSIGFMIITLADGGLKADFTAIRSTTFSAAPRSDRIIPGTQTWVFVVSNE